MPETEFLDRRKTVTDNIVTILNILNMETLKRAIRFQTVKKICRVKKILKIFIKIMFLMSKIMCFLHCD